MEAQTAARRRRMLTVARVPWPPSLAGLAAGSAALGLVLLVPRLFSDPVGVDPYLARVSAVGLALLAVTWPAPRLRPARAVLLALAAICAPFSAWLVTPRLFVAIVGDGASVPARLAVAGAVQCGLVAGFAGVALRLPRDRRPCLRLRRFGRGAVLTALAGTVLFFIVVMLMPARLLGREAVQPAMLIRDGPWMVVALSLQGAAQEVGFRGLLLGALERGAPWWAANLGQAVFFGFAHLAVQYEGPAGPFVPLTIALGLVLGTVTRRTNSLWPAIIIHAVADIAVTLGVLPGLYGY